MFRTKEQKIADARAEIEKTFQDFMNGEGRLPKGFSDPYHRTTASGLVLRGTPFDPYLNQIRNRVDALHDCSGISDWFYLDESVEINAAAAVISHWVKRHREMRDRLKEKCRIGHTTIQLPISTYCNKKTMIVIDDRRRFEDLTEESIQRCKEAEISFCIVFSDGKLYDLIEQKEKEIAYEAYPNYHDETYANWSFRSV